MLLFVHMHKCAGTTVVRSADASGLRLPRHHRNGNLLGPDGKAVKYASISKEEMDELIREQQDEGVEFIAMEGDFPPFKSISRRKVTLLTALRDPFDRAVSNFRHAKTRARVAPDLPFRDFLNRDFKKEGHLSRSANYYVRRLTVSNSTVNLERRHLRVADNILKKFKDVIVLGVDDLDERLRRLGITHTVTANVASSTPSRVQLSSSDTQVSEEDRQWFEQHNSLDRELFETWRRRSEWRLMMRHWYPETSKARSPSA